MLPTRRRVPVDCILVPKPPPVGGGGGGLGRVSQVIELNWHTDCFSAKPPCTHTNTYSNSELCAL